MTQPLAKPPQSAPALPSPGPKRDIAAAFSASRAKDFQQCPLLFRFRVVDRLPEAPSAAAIRGTLVHATLEKLFSLPAKERLLANSQQLYHAAWEELRKTVDPASYFAAATAEEEWLASGWKIYENYFRLEDPQLLAPTACEQLLEVRLANGILCRGFIDRVDMSTSGAIRIIDYKTGKSPAPAYRQAALFQMYFYALMVWYEMREIPAQLELLYLKNCARITLKPQPAHVYNFSIQLASLWQEVKTAAQNKAFLPRESKLCGWCAFQKYCPVFGNPAPPVNDNGIAYLLSAEQNFSPR